MNERATLTPRERRLANLRSGSDETQRQVVRQAHAHRRRERLTEIEYLRDTMNFTWEQVADDLGLQLESLERNLKRWNASGDTDMTIERRVA